MKAADFTSVAFFFEHLIKAGVETKEYHLICISYERGKQNTGCR